jgi:uncharacterized protein involved in exopolysaccharide biosynthesis
MAPQLGQFEDHTERAPQEDDAIVYLDWYVRALQRHWFLILAGVVLGAAIAIWTTSTQPVRYQGITTLLVVPPSEPGGAQINPATFRAIVENGTLAAQVIAELNLEGEVSPQSFVERALSVEEVRGTNIVRVKVTLPDPGKAAEASRRLAHKAILLTQQITLQEGTAIQDQLKSHLSDARERLAIAEKELLTYKQGAQVDVIEEDANAQLRERGSLLSLVVNIESERARLSAAEAEIKRQQPLLSTARVPAAEEALRRTQPASASGVDSQHLDLTNPYVNPVYQTLDFQIATSRAQIAALEKERDELVKVRKLGGKELAQLSELYRLQIGLARRQANFDLATKVHDELSLRYEQSRTRAFGSTAQLQVVDDALPPNRPVSRQRLAYGVFGAGIGLFGVALIILVWAGVARQERSAA